MMSDTVSDDFSFFPYFKAILVCTNGAIFVFLVILMCEHYYAGNSLKSWSFVFYVLNFCWLILRGTFWLLTVLTGRTWEAFEFYILYWVPVPMEICSFMLVPLFFVNILYPRQWSSYKIYIRPVYVVITCGLTTLSIIWSLLAAVSIENQHACIHSFQRKEVEDADDDVLKKCFRTEYTGYLFRSITAVCFLFLSVMQGLFGIKLQHLDDWQQLGLITIQMHTLSYLNIFLCFSFFSRVLYQVLAIFWDFQFASIPLGGSDDIPFLLFLIILFWDYLPTITILVTVVSPSLQGGLFSTRGRSNSRLEEPDVRRDRGDTELTSDSHMSADFKSESKGVLSCLQDIISAIKKRANGESLEGNNEGGRVHLGYGSDPALIHPTVSYTRHVRRPGIESGYSSTETTSLLSKNVNNRQYYDEHNHELSVSVQDPLHRFQRAPLLPIKQNGQMNEDNRYNSTQNSYPIQDEQTEQFSMKQLHDWACSSKKSCWGSNQNDSYFDPGLYAFSAIPRSRQNSISSDPPNKCFSPLDLHLQRDTSTQKYASYAPHTSQTSNATTPKIATASTFSSNTTGADGKPDVNLGYKRNPPSALDNALGAWKQNPQLQHLVSDNVSGSHDVMSPTAMSQESDTPTEFTLSSRVTNTTTNSGQNMLNSNLGKPSKLHSRINDNQEERRMLSSRPTLRNSSGNFLNLANLDRVDSGSNKSSSNNNNDLSTSDSKSAGSSVQS